MSGAITAIYAGAVGLLAVVLAARVVRLRRRYQVGVGSGGHEALALAVRAHANLLEYAPLAIVLLLLLELTAAPGWLVHALGALLVAGRLFHAWGLSRRAGYSTGRFYGTAATWLVIVVGSLILFARAVLSI